MKISPPALIVTVGTIMIVSAFALFGKAAPSDGPDSPMVPVPFSPTKASSGTIGYRYRGVFIGVSPAGTIPVEGFNSAWSWSVYGTKSFAVAPLSIGSAETKEAAITAAMLWVDGWRAGTV